MASGKAVISNVAAFHRFVAPRRKLWSMTWRGLPLGDIADASGFADCALQNSVLDQVIRQSIDHDL